jgi:hypothetical protein
VSEAPLTPRQEIVVWIQQVKHSFEHGFCTISGHFAIMEGRLHRELEVRAVGARVRQPSPAF